MSRRIISIIISIFILTTVFTACSITKSPGNIQLSNNDNSPTTLFDADGKISYTKVFQQSSAATLPLMPTDFDGVYYTMDTSGNVRFFRIIDGVLTEQKPNGVYSVSVRCSGQSIPADIYYIIIDGKTNGFGLYTFSSEYNIMLYDYAFFKLCELPASFAYGNELLLLIDTDKTRFYKDKVYSEQFYFDPDTSETAGYFLSEAQRQTGMDGIKMKDYKMFTDSILHQPFEEIYFFTSRAYVADTNKFVDIYTSGGYDTNVDNIQVVWDVLGMTFYRTSDGLYYYSTKDDGFFIYLYDNYNYEVIREFDGDFDNDYLKSGTSILETKTGIAFDMSDKKEYSFDYSMFGTGFTPTKFVSNGRYSAIVGESPSGGLQIGVFDKNDNTVTIFDDWTNRNMECIDITDDGFLVISVCYESNYTAFQMLCNLNNF